MQQGPYESIITYNERFDIAVKAYQDQEKAELAEPDILNEMYLLVNQWLKTTGPTQSGLASKFVTKQDMPDIGKPSKNKSNKQQSEKEEPEKLKSKEDLPKPKRDMSKVTV
jgi:hypothetical protein